jgi:hypothetical protein
MNVDDEDVGFFAFTQVPHAAVIEPDDGDFIFVVPSDRQWIGFRRGTKFL